MAKQRYKRSKKDGQEVEHHGGARPFWSGTISFGLVNIPVNLFPASRRDSVSLRMLDQDGTPLARRYYCPEHDRDVHAEHILRGYEWAEGEYVVVRDEELEAIEPKKTREIDLRRFVDLSEIPPLYFERTYFLTPDGNSNKAYRLLAEVMERKQRAGIATFVMRDREYLVAILAENGILRAVTLRFQDELRSPEEVGLPEPEKASRKDVTQLTRSIEKLAAKKLDVDLLHDEYAQNVRRLAEQKRKSEENVIELDMPESDEELLDDEEPEELDLLETIRASLRQSAGTRKSSHGNNGSKAAKSRSTRKSRLDSQSKDELYKRAQQLEIPQRSKLNRQELIEEIKRTEDNS